MVLPEDSVGRRLEGIDWRIGYWHRRGSHVRVRERVAGNAWEDVTPDEYGRIPVLREDVSTIPGFEHARILAPLMSLFLRWEHPQGGQKATRAVSTCREELGSTLEIVEQSMVWDRWDLAESPQWKAFAAAVNDDRHAWPPQAVALVDLVENTVGAAAVDRSVVDQEAFHYRDCGEVGGGWPHPASAHQVEVSRGNVSLKFDVPGWWDAVEELPADVHKQYRLAPNVPCPDGWMFLHVDGYWVDNSVSCESIVTVDDDGIVVMPCESSLMVQVAWSDAVGRLVQCDKVWNVVVEVGCDDGGPWVKFYRSNMPNNRGARVRSVIDDGMLWVMP